MWQMDNTLMDLSHIGGQCLWRFDIRPSRTLARGQRLKMHIENYLRKGFLELGFDIGNSETPIIPVMLGDEDKAKAYVFSNSELERILF